MVFSSIPPYLDPANWQQNPNNYFRTGNNDLLPPAQQPPPPPPPQHHGVGGAGSIRPGSMVDQARMANIPMPETALKCPRCESTHTKFCYFNNYSLSQPRHFCKTCRRYWTRGGALRSVPVGGGCRRNKRSSKGRSSSTSKCEPANSGSSNSTLPSYNTNAATPPTSNILGGLITSQIPQLRFMPPLTHLMDYGTPGRETGLNYGGTSGPVVSTTSEMNFQIGSNLFSGNRDGVASFLSSSGGGLEQWRLHQMPQFPNFLGGFDPSISHGGVLYQINNQDGGVEASKLSSSSSMMSQLASVKMEANTTTNNNNNHNHESNSARQFTAGPVEGIEHHWSTNVGTTAWTDLSG